MKGESLILPTNEIHVWAGNLLTAELPDRALNEVLSSLEIDRANRFFHERDQNRFLRRRLLLRKILGAYASTPPGDLEFAVDEYGSPSITSPKAATNISFSTSHSGDLAVVAVARQLIVGIDIEQMSIEHTKQEMKALTSCFFSPGEFTALAALKSAEYARGFLSTWTRKEALTKALGRGLSIPLNSFEVSVTPGKVATIIRWGRDCAAMEGLKLDDLALPEDYVGSVASNHRALICYRGYWLETLA
jgi:4'-phosphopantetheinyl transferase